MKFRQAGTPDIRQMLMIIEKARKSLKQSGVDQWQDGYPNRKDIEDDIAAHNAYVVTENDIVIGIVTVSLDGEDDYISIQGSWKSEQAYAVIHRMAVDDGHKGKGLSSEIIKNIAELCMSKGVYSIRVDTHEQNVAMNTVLRKNGFEYCGIVQVDNSDRVAYEKLLPQLPKPSLTP